MWLRFRVWCAVEVEAGRGRGNGAVPSGLWLGPGRALCGVGKAGGGRRERWAWFENFRIKNSWGVGAEEGSLIKNGAAALGSGVGVEVDLVFSPPTLVMLSTQAFPKSVFSNLILSEYNFFT